MAITKNKRTKYLGLDVGLKRVGVSISDPSKKIAFPYRVIISRSREELLEILKDIILKENVTRVVIGDPLNIQGKRSSLTEKLYEIIDFLRENLDVSAKLYDERYSTATAHEDLKVMNIDNKKRRKVIDKIAAAIILQNYLERK